MCCRCRCRTCRGPSSTRLPPRVVASMAERVGCWAPVVLCSWPASRWLGSRLDASGRVYLAFDDNSAFGNMSSAAVEQQQREEQRLLEESEVALAVSPRLLERFQTTQQAGLLAGERGRTCRLHAKRLSMPHRLTRYFGRSSKSSPTAPASSASSARSTNGSTSYFWSDCARHRRDVAFVLAGPVKAGTDLTASAGHAQRVPDGSHRRTRSSPGCTSCSTSASCRTCRVT